LKISIQDTGVGIKKEDQKKLFKLFGFVTDTQKMNTSGIGLGLVISECLVDNLGGKISLHSSEGDGSTFTFTVKLHKESESQTSQTNMNVNPNKVPNYKMKSKTKTKKIRSN